MKPGSPLLGVASADTFVELYRTMVRIRRFEEKIVEVYGDQDMKTPVHLYIGQEAIAAGVCHHLRDEDYLFTTHRSHGPCLAKGLDPKRLYAEFYGRVDGYCRGKGGSMHPADPTHGVLGTSAIVAGGIPHAVGAALASKMQGNGRIAVTLFGDGATEQGAFYESLSFASLHRLPVVFVCENNLYATTSPISARQPHDNIYRKAEGHDVPGVQVDGNDVVAVCTAAGQAVATARAGGGPTLLECRTYRWRGHVGPECDHEKGWRPKEDLHEWMARCPVERCRTMLLEQGILTRDDVEKIALDAQAEMDAAVCFAKESPMPDPAELCRDVFADNVGDDKD